jgi:histone acetyltransferase (RNA polymerase elongator complex component)
VRSCIQHLEEKIEALDFSGTLIYLEERYEKPYIKMIEKAEAKRKQPESLENGN